MPGRVQADSFDGPAFAVDPNGNAFVLWEDDREGAGYPTGPVALYAARRDGASGQWAPDQRFSQAGEAWGSRGLLAADGSGNFYAIWGAATGYGFTQGSITQHPINSSIRFSRWQPASALWSPGVALPEGVSPADIVADVQGDVHGVTDSFFDFRAAATGAWSTPVSFRDPVHGQAVGQPSVSVDAQGNDWVTWVDTRNEVVESSPSVTVIIHGREIWAGRRSAVAGVFGPNVRVDDHTVGSDRITPHVGADQRGNVYAAWLDYRDNPNGVGMPGTGAGDIYFSMAPGVQAVLPLVAKGSVAAW